MKAKTINAVITKRMNQWWETLPDDLRKNVERDTIVTGGCIASMLLGEQVRDFDVYFKTYDTALAVANHYTKRFVEHVESKGKSHPAITVDTQPSPVWPGERRVRIIVKSAGIANTDGTIDYHGAVNQPEYAQTYAHDTIADAGEIEDVYQETENSALESETPEDKFRPVFLSTNAITLSSRIQIVIRFFGDPDEIHKNYDFVHCTNYWTPKTGVVLNQPALESLLAKELRYIGSKYPVCSVFRIRKFVGRGWQINAGQIVKMCMQISALDLTNIHVLEEQLTGVDVAYFIEVLNLLKAKNKEIVDSAYLIEIINRMF